MADEGTRRDSTAKSAVGFAVIAVAIVAVIAAFALNPSLLEDVAVAAAIVIVSVAVIILAIYFIVAIAASPWYAYKGETTQTDKSYDLGGVRPVEGKILDEEVPAEAEKPGENDLSFED